MVQLAHFLYTNLGVAISGADVAVFTVATGADETTSSGSATATTTTDSAGFWQVTGLAEGIYDIRITFGTSIRWRRYNTELSLLQLETATLKIRNPADTFVYDILPAAIIANRTLTLPLLTGTDTMAVLALAQTFTNKTLTSPVINTAISGTAFLDEDDMNSDSNTQVASQQSIKKYVDDNAGRTSAVWVQPHAIGQTATLSVGAFGDDARYSGASVGSASAIGQAFMATVIPTDFTTLTKAVLLVLPVESGNLVWRPITAFGADQEQSDANTDNIAEATIGVIADRLEALDVAAAFTGIAAGDYLGLQFNREGDDAADTITTLHVIGLLLEYT